MFCKCDKWLIRPDAHHLPMTGHGILTIARLIHRHKISFRMFCRLYLLKGLEIGKPQSLQIRNIQMFHCF